MFGESPRSRESGMDRYKQLLPVFAAMIAGMASPDIAKAETPEAETIAVSESLGDASLATHVNGNEAIVDRAEQCKVAYDAAMALRDDTREKKKKVWLVIDTAAGGTAVKDHIQLAHDGYDALKACFEGSGEHPRIAHIVNNNSEDSGVSLRPVDGEVLERMLLDADPAVEGAHRVLSRTLTLDLDKEDPTFKDIRQTVRTPNLRNALRDVDSVSLGYNATRRTSGGHVWELNGQIGFTTEEGSGVVARGSTGVATMLSPVEGGRTTVGIAAELSRSEGATDYAAGSYLQASLGEGRPDLVISTLVDPDNGNIGFQSHMALRFSLTDLPTNRAQY